MNARFLPNEDDAQGWAIGQLCGEVERTASEPRLQAFEAVDKANEDALWEHNEWREGCVNKACEAIRALGKDFTSDQLFTILCTAETTLYENGQPELAEQVGSFACEVQ